MEVENVNQYNLQTGSEVDRMDADIPRKLVKGMLQTKKKRREKAGGRVTGYGSELTGPPERPALTTYPALH